MKPEYLLILAALILIYIVIKYVTAGWKLKSYLFLHHRKSWEYIGGSSINYFQIFQYANSAINDDDENVVRLKKKAREASRLLGFFWGFAFIVFGLTCLFNIFMRDK